MSTHVKSSMSWYDCEITESDYKHQNNNITNIFPTSHDFCCLLSLVCLFS